MLETAALPTVATDSGARDQLVQAFRWMLLARVLDDKFASLYRAGKIHGGVFLGRGQEALSVAVGAKLRRGDVYAPLIRDGAGRLAFGEPVLDAVRTYLGSPLGPMRARDGNVHRGRPREGLLPMLSHLGAMISVVNGVLIAKRFNGETDFVGATNIGDGATSTGAFHEAINQAAVEKLPLILTIADNQYAYSTPTSSQFACASLADKAVGYGVDVHEADGTDLVECMRVAGAAVAKARAGGGPQMIVARLLRLCGHGEHDDAHYVETKLKQSGLGRDCLKVAEEFLVSKTFADAASLAVWRSEAVREVEQAVAMVQREGAPDPFVQDWSALSTTRLMEARSENL
ncbi:MAG TPA: thiamine pyrophosphate-dependent enzyme [Verrucomicrobiae bacterium]|jgi:pyruvate dehydrogenase E1 component alpha subunit/2-oxoisovalerate dehydrogenase E1 component alpha subunit